ncbi:MAG: transposase [candidate division Zixibacteria bacterium]|nr:transposase [candidate division Zixibacteria bacterium]
MFRKSPPRTEPDDLSSIESHFKPAKLKAFNDPLAWHNVFHDHITARIDENIFSVLYDERQGRPNAPVRVLASLTILKKGFAGSDEALFEACGYNLLMMKALGLSNLNDSIPTLSTYYKFKQSLYNYQTNTGEDLIGDLFRQLGKDQAEVFGVNGDKIRMDSKLIGSNIAQCSRLQLILGCLQVFWKSLNLKQKMCLSPEDRKLMDELMKKKPGQIVYRLNDEEKEEKLKNLGELLLRLQGVYAERDSDKYMLIERLLAEQYTLEEGRTILKENKEIAADSLQSPHDADATYRKKKDQKVQGYSVNVTETCNGTGLELVTDVQVEAAGHADNHYVQPAIENTEKVVGEVKDATMDGAYNDESNREYADDNEIELHFTGLQGAEGRYAFENTPEGGWKVTDRKTGETQTAVKCASGKYRITLNGKYKYRYFTEGDIESYLRRQEIKNMPAPVKNRRNNVEATIFQLSYYTRNNKTRYRGKMKTQAWASCRGMWMNLVRIVNYLGEPRLAPAV